MKLYATTTSERASKGQGGEWLKIAIENEDRKKVAIVHVNALYNGKTGITLEYLPEVYATDMPTTLLGQTIDTKGNKQKDGIERAECLGCVPGQSACEEHTI